MCRRARRPGLLRGLRAGLHDLSLAAAWHGHIGPELYADERTRQSLQRCVDWRGVEQSRAHHADRVKERRLPRIFYQWQTQTRNRKSERRQTTTATRPMLIDGIADYLDDGGKVIDAER
jgi:hypothetical protein